MSAVLGSQLSLHSVGRGPSPQSLGESAFLPNNSDRSHPTTTAEVSHRAKVSIEPQNTHPKPIDEAVTAVGVSACISQVQSTNNDSNNALGTRRHPFISATDHLQSRKRVIKLLRHVQQLVLALKAAYWAAEW